MSWRRRNIAAPGALGARQLGVRGRRLPVHHPHGRRDPADRRARRGRRRQPGRFVPARAGDQPARGALPGHRRQYDPHAQISRLDRAAAVLGSTAAAAIVVAALVQLTHPSATAAGLIAIQFALATALLLVWRMVWATARRQRAQAAHLRAAHADHRRRRGRRRTRAPPRGAPAARPDRGRLRRRRPAHRPSRSAGADAPVLGSTAAFDAIVDETGAEHAIFAFQAAPDSTLRRLVRRCAGPRADDGDRPAAVRRHDQPDGARAHRGHPGVRAAPRRPQGLGVRDQARLRPQRRRGRLAGALARDRHHGARREALVPGPGAVPPAARRPRRQGLRRAQVPLDAPGAARRRPAEARRRRRPRRGRGRGPPNPGRALHPQMVAGRDPAAVQRAPRRHEPRRARARSARSSPGGSPSASAATTSACGSSRGSPAGRRSTSSAREPRSPTAPSSTTGTSRTGPCGWTRRSC